MSPQHLMKLKRFSKHYERKALTLIEVVASLALLSTLLVFMLSAYSAHLRQINLADQKIRACEALDQLVAGYFETGDPLPTNEEGSFSDHDAFYWRSMVLPTRASNPTWQANTIRIEAYSTETNQSVATLELLARPQQNPAATQTSLNGSQSTSRDLAIRRTAP